MNINLARLEERIAILHKIGIEPSGGNTRLAFSAEDAQARALFKQWLEEAGMLVSIDDVGNMIGRLEGSQEGLAAIAIGSHLDTVPDGGMYDGVLGCLAGLECAVTLRETGYKLRHPLEVIVFADEEGSRFGTVLLGSRAMAGTLKMDELKQARDTVGTTAFEAMQNFGLHPEHMTMVKRSAGEIAAYLELHIEQGAVLENAQIDIGVVTGIVGIKRYEVNIYGEANHAGTTPFSLRKDALLAAAEMIMAVREETARLGKDATVGTVGQLQVWPGAVNVVPGQVRFTLEIRDTDATLMTTIEQALQRKLNAIAGHAQVGIEIAPIADVPPVPLYPQVQAAIIDAAEDLKISYRVMPSGAGHDAQSMAGFVPTGMIFVPSVRGISHSPNEKTEAKYINKGVNTLLKTIINLDAR